MAFVLDEVAVGQVVLQFPFSFILSVSLHQYFVFHSSTIITTQSKQLTVSLIQMFKHTVFGRSLPN